MNNEFDLISAQQIQRKVYENNNYLIDNLLKGNKVSILTGGSKTGKTTFALQIANAVSKGDSFLGKKTKQADVLYICMDNEEDLIAERIELMNLEMNDHVTFCFNKQIKLGNDDDTSADSVYLIEVLDAVNTKCPNLSLVIIDLFDNIRSLTVRTESNNVKDAEDIDYVKAIANCMKVHILLLNHDTKSGVQNGYSSSKGGVKFVGSCNGSYLHLIRNGIGETNAILEVGGRNIKEDRITLQLDTSKMVYSIAEQNIDDDMPYEVGLIRNFIIKNNGYEGTISNLLQLTKLTIAANRCSRLLNVHKDLLKSEGISFSINPSRSNGRIYSFSVTNEDDKDDISSV